MIIQALRKMFRVIYVECLWYRFCTLKMRMDDLRSVQTEYPYGSKVDVRLSREIDRLGKKAERVCQKLGMSKASIHLPLKLTVLGTYPAAPAWLFET